MEDPSVEWAEPVYIRELYYDPSDTLISRQWYLGTIHAKEAWELFRGDSTIVIGIIDTGVNFTHPDLAAHIWTNPNEIPGNGVDDDGNGVVDDINGYDFADNDNDPTPSTTVVVGPSYHGTTTAGIAAAVTDNVTGIASPSFNARIMAVKTSNDDDENQYVVAGYEGIEYAAFNGAHIINCSFGGPGASNYEQAIIEDAIALGALIVAAAGNEDIETEAYPASYPGVLSVAATDQNDLKSNFSNYDYSIDLSAPGVSMYTTLNEGYAYANGTSYSAPLVSSVAALVMGYYPEWTGLQVGEQVRVSSVSYNNPPAYYEEKLGRGIVDAYRALTLVSPSIRIADYSFTEGAGSNGDGIFDPGEQIRLQFSLINYLEPASNILLTVQTDHPDVSVTDGEFAAGSLGMLEQVSNAGDPVVLQIDPLAERGQSVDLLFRINAGGGYEDLAHLQFTISPSYAEVAGSNVSLTITATGKLGFADYPDNRQGEGFLYKGENLLFEGAVMAATGATRVSDAARGADQNGQNNDFQPIQGGEVVVWRPGPLADEQGRSIFTDELASGNLNLKVRNESLGFGDAGAEDFILLSYTLKPTIMTRIEGLFFGLFMDWDVGNNGLNARLNKPGWDGSRSLGFIYDYPTGLCGGLAVVSQGGATVYASVHNPDDIYNGYTDLEKWSDLSHGIQTITRNNADDYSHVVGIGPVTIDPGDSVIVGFAVIAGDDSSDVKVNADAAQAKWQELYESTGVADEGTAAPAAFALRGNYPNPFNPETAVVYDLAGAADVVLTVHDLLGREVARLVDEHRPAGQYEAVWDGTSNGKAVPAGIYFARLQARPGARIGAGPESGDFSAVRKMLLVR